MKFIWILTVAVGIIAPGGGVSAGEFWRTSDHTVHRVDDDGAWYRSTDNGKTWKMLLLPATPKIEEKSDPKVEKIRLSPNPVSSILRIELLEHAKKRPILYMIDAAGQTAILSGRMVIDGNGIWAVDISEMARGAYTLIVEYDNQRISHTVILQ